MAAAVVGVTYLVPGLVVSSFTVAVYVSLALTVVTIFIKPVLKILTLPLTIITFGIFSLILQGILLFVVSLIIPGFEIETALAAIIGGVILGIVSSILFNNDDN